MSWFDILRLLIFACYGLGVAFMVVTNFIAYMVLRPPKKLGFLWWHVTAISVSFLCFGTVAIERVTRSFGDDLSWRTWVTLAGVVTFAASQVIIFSVERDRLMDIRAVRRAATNVS